MPIVGGLDIHRKQITFDYLDTVTGQVRRGQIAPADREHLRAWLARFAGRDDVAFAMEGCTGWRYVAEELAAAGIAAHLAEPADTAVRPRPQAARQDRQDRLPGTCGCCWPRAGCRSAGSRRRSILEYRALLETYHDLRPRAHRLGAAHPRGASSTRAPRRWARARCAPSRAWPRCGRPRPRTCRRPGSCRSPPPWTCSPPLEARLHALRHQLLDAARHLTGAKVLAARLYGVGPVTALALTCWLAGAGRFSSSRKAVRFAGLDITVCSSDRKGPPGRLSRQGPPVLRWAVYEAGKTHARASAPDHAYYAAGQGPQATASAPRCPRPARSSGRPATSWPSSATTRSPPPETPHRAMVTSP